MWGYLVTLIPADWSATVSALGAVIAAVAAIIAWVAPRGSGPTVGWDAIRRRGAPTGAPGAKIGSFRMSPPRDPDDVLVRNVGWRSARQVQIVLRAQVFSQVDDLGLPTQSELVWESQPPVFCERLDPNSGVAVPVTLWEEGDTVVEVSWLPTRWGARRMREWTSAPLP